MNCKKCGGELMDGNTFCVNCGERTENSEAAVVNESTIPTPENNTQLINEQSASSTVEQNVQSQVASDTYGGGTDGDALPQAPQAPQAAQYTYGASESPPNGAQYVYGGNTPNNAPNMQASFQQGAKPISSTLYVVLSIIMLLCCCLLGGIVALVYAVKIDNCITVGDYVGAEGAAKKSRMWLIISLIVGVVSTIIAMVVFMYMGFNASDFYSAY